MMNAKPVGVFDSGVGGLSVLRAIRAQFPRLGLIYCADQARVPYGQRSAAEVRRYAEEITRFLLGQGAGTVVVACNTASAAALSHLRATFADIPVVGMEPAVKPAGEHTRSGVVGVLATPATFQSELYAALVTRFARGVRVLQATCAGLVQEIEAGRTSGAETERILRAALEPMLAKGADTVVLGCTHYPFAMDLIQQIAGPDVRIIDPAPAVARQVGRVTEQPGKGRDRRGSPAVRYYTSGDARAFSVLLPGFMGEAGSAEQVSFDSIGS